jgi:signal transduction histidine kinase
VAHDFNNTLAVITGYSEIALAQTDLPIPLSQILTESQRGVALTGQLLPFSRKSLLARQELEVNEVVSGVEPLFRQLVGSIWSYAWNWSRTEPWCGPSAANSNKW